jgi:hypothetical protein
MTPSARALVHQGDGRHPPLRHRRSPEWASERRWLRGDGFEPPSNRRGKDTTTVSCFRVSLEGCTPTGCHL